MWANLGWQKYKKVKNLIINGSKGKADQEWDGWCKERNASEGNWRMWRNGLSKMATSSSKKWKNEGQWCNLTLIYWENFTVVKKRELWLIFILKTGITLALLKIYVKKFKNTLDRKCWGQVFLFAFTNIILRTFNTYPNCGNQLIKC